MSNTKDTDKYSYFKFIPSKMYFGIGCYCAFSWIAATSLAAEKAATIN